MSIEEATRRGLIDAVAFDPALHTDDENVLTIQQLQLVRQAFLPPSAADIKHAHTLASASKGAQEKLTDILKVGQCYHCIVMTIVSGWNVDRTILLNLSKSFDIPAACLSCAISTALRSPTGMTLMHRMYSSSFSRSKPVLHSCSEA